MKVPWEDKLPCAALALLVLAVFYGIYFAKMLAQKRRGIQTRQIGRRREKDILTVEVLMSMATLGAPIAQLLIDPLYLSALCGLFGGGDMNGIALLCPEWAVRCLSGALLIANALVFWRRILPVYRQSFSERRTA